MPADTVDLQVKKLARRYERLRSQRDRLIPVWDLIDRYIAPVTDPDTLNDESDLPAHDVTAIDGYTRLSSSIQQATASEVFRWSKMSLKGDSANDNRVMAEKVEDATFLNYSDSDFYLEYAAAVKEILGKGTGFMFQEPKYASANESPKTFEGIEYTSIPCREALFDLNRKSEIKNFFWGFKWTASQVIDHCEARNFPVPQDIKEADEKDPTTTYEIVLAIFERPTVKARIVAEKAADKYNEDETLAPEERLYGSVFFRADKQEPISAYGGYYECPVYSCFWDRESGQHWGFGISNVALPIVLFLNAWMEYMDAAAEKAVDPPLLADKRLIESIITLAAGKINYVVDIERAIKPLISGQRIDYGQLKIEDIRNQIERLYHVDDLQLKDSPAMTAMEAQIRYELMNRILGGNLTRIQNFLSRIQRGTVAILKRAGVLPQDVQNALKGKKLEFQYQGPLARSQRTDEVAALERWAAQVAGLSNMFPEATAIINVEKLLRAAALKLGIPADCLNSPAFVAKRVAEMRAQQAQAIQADTARKQAAALKDATAAQSNAGGGFAAPAVPGLTPQGMAA